MFLYGKQHILFRTQTRRVTRCIFTMRKNGKLGRQALGAAEAAVRIRSVELDAEESKGI